MDVPYGNRLRMTLKSLRHAHLPRFRHQPHRDRPRHLWTSQWLHQKSSLQGVGQSCPRKSPGTSPAISAIKTKAGSAQSKPLPTPLIDLANPRPGAVDRELPIETGLATLFEALRDAPVEKPKSVTLVRNNPQRNPSMNDKPNFASIWLDEAPTEIDRPKPIPHRHLSLPGSKQTPTLRQVLRKETPVRSVHPKPISAEG